MTFSGYETTFTFKCYLCSDFRTKNILLETRAKFDDDDDDDDDATNAQVYVSISRFNRANNKLKFSTM